MKKLLVTLSLACLALINAYADRAAGIHVDGNQLKDDAGNIVVLHGFMDTPSPYFNNWRWGGSATDANAAACITYFKKIFTATTQPEKGTNCNLFRLHLDPCWTNNSSVTATGFTKKNDKWYDPNGTEVSGEADIHQYDGKRLDKYMKLVYWKIAESAIGKGMHVIMRPPGVCPGTIKVGDYYQKYLIDVWDRVTKNDSVLKNYKHVSIELANEPVGVKMANGSESDQALRDFFQPVVDKIRANGFKGIIWVPGSGWQANYRPYAKYPVIDPLHNLGYAVHDYVGWYDTSDSKYDINNSIKAFGEAVPVVRTNPIVITEVDWSPYKPGTGHYDEHGKYVESNYGTWATGSTSKWGKAYKAVLDYYGNISMTLSGSHCYFDWDSYDKSRAIVPAFPGIKEACGEACFEWYAEYAKVNYPSYEHYQTSQEIPQNPIAFEKDYFNPTLLYEGTFSKGATYSAYSAPANGIGGWRYEEPLDISGYKSIEFKLRRPIATTSTTTIRFYDSSDIWGDYAEQKLSGSKFSVSLEGLKTKAGKDLDLKNIRIICFHTSAVQSIYFEEAFFSIDGETDATTGINGIAVSNTDNNKYDLVGRLIKGNQKGLYIKNGKKYFAQ